VVAERTGRHDAAIDCWRQALTLYRARGHFEQAVLLFTDLGLPEAGQIRARLADLDTSGRPVA
jgi:hypothetical protein